MTFDSVKKVGNSLLHYGTNNDRIYLMKLFKADLDNVNKEIENLVKVHKYSKVIIKIPLWAKSRFDTLGYKVEAVIPNLFSNSEDGFFMAKYLDEKRCEITRTEYKSFSSVIKSASSSTPCVNNSWGEFEVRKLNEEDVSEIIELYKEVFRVYPFPIFQEDFLIKSMKEQVMYFGAFFKNELVAVSSAEIDRHFKNAEMTDFATRMEYRGKSLSNLLLKKMIDFLKDEKIYMLYTIARANSYSMNKTFGKENFQYGGTLKNNTNIGESIESMNVWFKNLVEENVKLSAMTIHKWV